MIPILMLHLVAGTALLVAGERPGRRGFAVGAVVSFATLIWGLFMLPSVRAGHIATSTLQWVPGLDLNFDFALDAMSLTMVLIVGAVGTLVFVYAGRYYDPSSHGLPWHAGLLVLFAGSMVGLVTADNVYVLYVSWEGTTITSYFLIGHNHEQARARAAALQALLTTAAGGFAMLGGLVLLARAAGTTSLHAIVSSPLPENTSTAVALALILLGAFTKSAQYPFHAWLPGAMEAPTPVSAFLHSATMVTAGVYLIARFAPLYPLAPFWRPAVLIVGLASMVFGGLRALRQVDLKLLLAHGTVSQLGFMIVLFGVGTPEATRAGWMLLIAHAAFKGALFMVVGIVDHTTGTRRIGEVPRFGASWRGVKITTALALASMAGVPLIAGFAAKETAFGAFARDGFDGHFLVLAGIVAGSALTVTYAFRFWFGLFGRSRAGRPVTVDAPGSPGALFVAPPAVLAVAGVVLGLGSKSLDSLAGVAGSELGLGRSALHLAPWHGFDLPLALSLFTLAAGLALAAGRRQIQPILARGAVIPTGDQAYLAILRALAAIARRVTGAVQNGSLPVYSGVILATVLAAPGIALLTQAEWPGWPRFGSPGEVALLALLCSAATGAALVRRRFSAAVLLSIVGYAMAGLFLLSGAPDLALTQATIETLSTVVFVLVLRRLPKRFDRDDSPRRRTLRLLVSVLVASIVFGFALVAQGALTLPPISGEMVERAVPDGHGHNVVNVILVDFRGLDTLLEITVLAAAAVGAVALARAGRLRPPRRDDPDVTAAAEVDRQRRIVFVDGTVHIIFPAILMMSLWLLFAGHNQPGGGFVGGLLAGSAIGLRYVAGGASAVRDQSRFKAWTVLGVGVFLAAITATLPLAFGGSVLEVASAVLHPPLLGEISVSSALVFDLGVYLTVVGTVMMAFEAFGDDAPEAAS
ncbi:MAG TPA: hydrogen gas-evolving membrane-bound hydrogenase subunit E [Acidimicrobiales bacterium]|nr:hydrogen gas-evolving membrane-bound hydrogenase subunit E [Acidimicrobiales bacterium]